MPFDVDFPSTLFCLRCGVELKPGSGDFYIVRIKAFADPTPPAFSAEDLEQDHRTEIDRLLERLSSLSGQEAMDQVYRRLTVYLCSPCYQQWIERPVG